MVVAYEKYRTKFILPNNEFSSETERKDTCANLNMLSLQQLNTIHTPITTNIVKNTCFVALVYGSRTSVIDKSTSTEIRTYSKQ